MKKLVFTDPPLALTDEVVETICALPGVEARVHRAFAADEEELAERGRDAQIVITDLTEYRAVLREWPKLEAIITTSVGVDHIDTEYCRERGIRVVNFPGFNARAVAEMAMAIYVSLVRQVPQAQRFVQGGEWDFRYFEGSELEGKTLGLVGAGHVGREVARIAWGYGMGLVAYTAHPDEVRAREMGVGQFETLEAVLRQADCVVVAVPAVAATRHLIGRAQLKLMRPTAVLVNVGRGSVVDTLALAEALYEQRLAGAALDVIEGEPFRLRQADPRIQEMVNSMNVVVTPHIAFNTRESIERLSGRVLEVVQEMMA